MNARARRQVLDDGDKSAPTLAKLEGLGVSSVLGEVMCVAGASLYAQLESLLEACRKLEGQVSHHCRIHVQ